MKNILVTIPLREEQKKLLEAAGHGCVFIYNEHPGEEILQRAEIIVGNLPVKTLAAATRLELLQLQSAGYDPYVVPGALPEQVLLCNATGAYGKAVGEHALAMTLALLKKLYLYRDAQNRAEWKDLGPVTSISDATVLIIGLGDIGCAYARMVKALGAKRIIGLKRRPVEAPSCVDEICLTEDLEKVLPEADIIFSILPGSAKDFYRAEHFELMKESAVFINCGRGNVVDGAVLSKALTDGQIAAAAIDVTDPEPLPDDSPLWGIPNLLITPHVAGYPHLAEITDGIAVIAARNIHAYLKGETPSNLVEKTK